MEQCSCGCTRWAVTESSGGSHRYAHGASIHTLAKGGCIMCKCVSTMYHAAKHDSTHWHAVAACLTISFAYACSPVGSASTCSYWYCSSCTGTTRVSQLRLPSSRAFFHRASSASVPRAPVGALLPRIWAKFFGIGACLEQYACGCTH